MSAFERVGQPVAAAGGMRPSRVPFGDTGSQQYKDAQAAEAWANQSGYTANNRVGPTLTQGYYNPQLMNAWRQSQQKLAASPPKPEPVRRQPQAPQAPSAPAVLDRSRMYDRQLLQQYHPDRNNPDYADGRRALTWATVSPEQMAALPFQFAPRSNVPTSWEQAQDRNYQDTLRALGPDNRWMLPRMTSMNGTMVPQFYANAFRGQEQAVAADRLIGRLSAYRR